MCREFEQLLEKRRATADLRDSIAIDLHVRTCTACRRTYDQYKGTLQQASSAGGFARTTRRASIFSERTSLVLRYGLVTVGTLAAAMLMIQWFGNKPATPVVHPATAGRVIAAQVEKALAAPQKLVESTIAVATEVQPPAKAKPVTQPHRTVVARMASAPILHAPARRTSSPVAAGVPNAPVKTRAEPAKFAIIHNAGAEPLLLAVGKPDAAGPKGAKPGFAVISGMSSGPVYVEVVPYQDPVHAPQVANVFEAQPTEPKRTAIIAGLED